MYAFGSGMEKTEYPGAVSKTNSKKSFSKETVVNSRQIFFCSCRFQRKERHLQREVCFWLSGQRKRIKETIILGKFSNSFEGEKPFI